MFLNNKCGRLFETVFYKIFPQFIEILIKSSFLVGGNVKIVLCMMYYETDTVPKRYQKIRFRGL